ncbi:MAG: DUF3570 domain-containing protein [Labilibaculum sp.]|nr:DUF3570 domain-containing protein [Labilibaculum sp.]MBI9057088.1 DUF3570 domain-containing protein [Labilibaculum sp.]
MNRNKALYLLFLFLLGSLCGFAQDNSKSKIKLDKEQKDTEVNFLFNYYAQDGDNSPVTGGIGSEKLNNYSSSIVVHLLPDSLTQLTLELGIDAYTSASTDKIDYFKTHQSSASGKDGRAHINADYTRQLAHSENKYGFHFGFSIESDIYSLGIGGKYMINSKDLNRSLRISTSYFRDNWHLIYPHELRSKESWLSTDIRNTLSIELSLTQVLNQKSTIGITVEPVFQFGLLSTPFHRVFFNDAAGKLFDDLEFLSHTEQLPNRRFKLPISLRYHYYLNDFFRFKSYYRIYSDTWGIQAHTASIETPFFASQTFILAPFFRYHTQSAARYFAPFATVNALNPPRYHTADYDLSKLHSYKTGIGISYAPIFAIRKFKSPFKSSKTAQLKSINLRSAYYKRSDGLKAWLISLDLGFIF